MGVLGEAKTGNLWSGGQAMEWQEVFEAVMTALVGVMHCLTEISELQ
ncbi:hypothetical protein [Phormidesmis priestleyi]|nr:hypothetical protein [Phormidesmis priestleyi]